MVFFFQNTLFSAIWPAYMFQFKQLGLEKSSFFNLIKHNLLYLISNEISENGKINHVIYFYDDSFKSLFSGKIKKTFQIFFN